MPCIGFSQSWRWAWSSTLFLQGLKTTIRRGKRGMIKLPSVEILRLKAWTCSSSLGDSFHGCHMARSGDDPLGVYSSMVEFLKNGGKGARQGPALENVIKAFPKNEGFDYEALESVLPVGVTGPAAEVYQKARRGLLT